MSDPAVTAAVPDQVQIVKQLYEAFAGRRIEEILPLLASDVAWSEPPNPLNPAAGTRHGHAGFLEWARLGGEAEEILVLRPEQYLRATDTVAVVGFARCRVRRTGRVYDTDFVHLVRLRGAQVVRFQEFFDTYAATEAFRTQGATGSDAA